MKKMLKILALIVFASCNKNSNDTTATQDAGVIGKSGTELVEISTAEADSISKALLIADNGGSVEPDTLDNPFVQPPALGKGDTEKQWKSLLKNVFENYTFKNPAYLGVSNRKGVGTILDRKQEIERVLAEMIDDSTYQSFIVVANRGPLEAANSKKFNFNFVVDANALGVDGELKNKISRSDSSSLQSGSWKINELKWGDLKDAISRRNPPQLEKFDNDLNYKRNVIVSKALEINGFTSKIYTSSDINTDLKAKIDTSIARIKSIDGSISFKVLNKRTILAESKGHFYVYGVLSKKKTR